MAPSLNPSQKLAPRDFAASPPDTPPYPAIANPRITSLSIPLKASDARFPVNEEKAPTMAPKREEKDWFSFSDYKKGRGRRVEQGY